MRQREVPNDSAARPALHTAVRAGAWVVCVALLVACGGPPKSPAPFELTDSSAPPQFLNFNECRPIYPAEAKRNAEQGRVEMRVLIETSGTISQVEIAKSSGFPLLDQAAQSYARCLRYEPGRKDGRAVPMWFDVPVNFMLQGVRAPEALPTTGWAHKM